MAVRIIRRPRAKTSASIAPSSPVALRQSELGDSLREVLFCHQTITTIDLDPPRLNQ
jgi:hypothetical protein